MAKADLIAKAQEMGIELTGKETVAQLEELIKPIEKPVVASTGEAPTLAGGATPSSDTVIMSKEEFEKNSTPTKTSFDVYNPDGVFVRTYTLEIHGENAEALASEFAAHTGGVVR